MIRIQNTLTPRPYVLHDDPAIDVDSKAYDWPKFVETGDVSCLPTRDGCRPTVFMVRSLTRKQFQHVQGIDDVGRKANETVAYGVVSWKDFVDASGRALTPQTKKSDLGERLSDRTLDEIYSPALFSELAVLVWSLSSLGFSNGQG